MRAIERALGALRSGLPVLVYDADGREEETDVVMAASFIEPEHVRMMRRDAGGLICAALHPSIASRLGLPFLTEVLSAAAESFPVLRALEPRDIPYDERSSFSITVNHRRTFTGITDRDRALTLRELARLAELNGDLREEFGRRFRSPGHVPLLRAHERLLEGRRGHTELSVALLELAGLTPVSVICEMMGDSGDALSKAEARRYAERRGLVFLEGEELVEAWSGSKFFKQTPVV